MPLLTQGKTNWRFLLIVVVSATFVGGGTWWFIEQQKAFFIEFPEIKVPGKTAEEECRFIQDLTKQAKCFTNLAKETEDESYCELIEVAEAPEVKANCYSELAILKNNPSICWKVETASLASSCWEYFGMKDWQTYRNEEYGFEVKYPEGFTEQKIESEDILLSVTKDGSHYFVMSVREKYNVNQIIPSIEEVKEVMINDHLGYEYFYVEGAGASEVLLVQVGQDALNISLDYIDDKSSPIAEDKKDYVQSVFNQILSTFRFTEPITETTPVIDSISPDSGATGTVIELKGKNFDFFSSIHIENSIGEGGIIWALPGSSKENDVKFILPRSICKTITESQGIPSCSGYLSLVPGKYKIYITDYGEKSNEVYFTVKSSPTIVHENYKSEEYGFEIEYPNDLLDFGNEPLITYFGPSTPENFTVVKRLSIDDDSQYVIAERVNGYLEFGIATSSDAVSSCQDTDEVYGAYNISNEVINGILFTKYDYVYAGLGNRLGERVFTTIKNNVCYRIAIITDASFISVGIGPGLTREMAEEEVVRYELPFSVYYIFDKLTPVLSTFRFIETTEGFCGWSTHGSCTVDIDCITDGCSGQVCRSKNEEPIITTCEWQDCYDDEAYGVECKCIENKCQWIE